MSKYEEGKYRLRVKSQGFKSSKNDIPQVVIECDVLGKYDPQSGECHEVDNHGTRSIYRALQTKEKSSYDKNGRSLFEALVNDINSVFSVGLISVSQLYPGATEGVDLTGKEFNARMKYWGDQDNEGWDWIRSGGVETTVSLDDLKKLEALAGSAKSKQPKPPAKMAPKKKADPSVNPLTK